jgi:hypothetical protein
MLSSAIVVLLGVVGFSVQRREDDAVAVLIHGPPAVTPVWGHDPDSPGIVSVDMAFVLCFGGFSRLTGSGRRHEFEG